MIQAIKSLEDVWTARGHPLFPQDHARPAKKWTYSNWFQRGGKIGVEEKKEDRARVYCILKLPFQWNRNSWLDRHFSTTNNLSLLQVKASDIVSIVNQGGVKSGRSPDQRSHRSFFLFFFFLGFRFSFLAASPLAPHARSRTTVTQ